MHFLKTFTLGTIGIALSAGTVLFGMTAQAADIPIPTNKPIGLAPVEGKLKSVVSLANASRKVESRVTLEFTLGTCVDQLLPPMYTVEKRDGILYLYVSGLNAKGDASYVKCMAGPYPAYATVTVPGAGYNAKNLKVVNLTSRLVRE